MTMEPIGVIIVAIVAFAAGFILTKWYLSNPKEYKGEKGGGGPLPSDGNNKENQSI